SVQSKGIASNSCEKNTQTLAMLAVTWTENALQLQEASNSVSRKITKSLLPTPEHVYYNFVKNNGLQVSDVNNTLNKPKPVYNSSPYRKQLTRKELDEKRAKSQCFYCDRGLIWGCLVKEIMEWKVKEKNKMIVQTVTSTPPKSQGPEASGALFKKSKRPKSKNPPIKIKVTPPKPTKGSEQSYPVFSGIMPDPQDLDRDIQLATMIPLLDDKVLRVLGERLEEKERLLMSAKAIDKKQEEIVVVRDFLEAFSNDLSGLPPIWEIEFWIELIPRVVSIVKYPFHLAPSKLEELSGQLKELQDNGFIRPSSSPWGAPIQSVKKKDVSFRMCIDYR
nr:putative reverse transcriptase domain-containing protein [Tanacetum cinerariifolium]